MKRLLVLVAITAAAISLPIAAHARKHSRALIHQPQQHPLQVADDPWPHRPPHKKPIPPPPHKSPIPLPPGEPPGHGGDDDDDDGHDHPHLPPDVPRPAPPVHPPPPPHRGEPMPVEPTPDEPDIRPHYNLLLRPEIRSLFLVPFAFLVLWGIHAVLMYAGAAYQERRHALIMAHPHEFGVRTDEEEEASAFGHGYGYGGAAGPATSATTTGTGNLADRNVGESEVTNLMRAARGIGVAAEGTRESEPLLASSRGGAAAGASPSAQQGAARQQQQQQRLSLIGDAPTEPGLDPVRALFDEFASTGPDPAECTAGGRLRGIGGGPSMARIRCQTDGVAAVRNGGQVAAMLFAASLATAIMGALAVLALPAPTMHDDVVGSKDRVLTLVMTQFGLLGIGVLWAMGETTFVAVHDLARLRMLAAAALLALLIVQGIAMQAENGARLREIDRIRRPPGGGLPGDVGGSPPPSL
ncbi:hypothetical protein BC828DRAFT_409447 [Blastocladiella britannica]|nr:hypothetical protein BC828DRAFT_409447 [Blastocladiella britannica]